MFRVNLRPALCGGRASAVAKRRFQNGPQGPTSGCCALPRSHWYFSRASFDRVHIPSSYNPGRADMADVTEIIDRVRSGDRIKFFFGFYGDQWIELSRGRVFRRRQRYRLTANEMDEIKSALYPRRKPRVAPSAQP